jgi:hypothetical protein
MTTPDTIDTSRDGTNSPRVFSRYGKYAHNVWANEAEHGVCIYCGRLAPERGWLGFTEKQHEKALGLPYCEEVHRG